MTKLYRFVPDFLSTSLKENYIGNISLEDVLYSLGVINYYDMKNAHIGVSGYDTGHVYPLISDRCFFFYNPYSIIRVFEYNAFSDVIKVLEYDIPDEIVRKSEKAHANYINYDPKGVLIDIDLLHDEDEIQVDNSILEKKMLELERDVINYLSDALKKEFTDEELKSLNKYRLFDDKRLYKSKYITGNTTYVSKNDMESLMPSSTFLRYDVNCKPSEFSLRSKDKTIFTDEGYKDYDLDIPGDYLTRVLRR